ncbi:MAG: hypothetical protein ABSE64_05735 [Vulcanimicrobiaceae bacterium]
MTLPKLSAAVMRQQTDSAYRAPWRSALFGVLLTIVVDLMAFRWGQQLKVLLFELVGFGYAMYAVYVGIFRITGLWRRVIVFAFTAGCLSLLSALVVDTLQLRVIAISCGVGLLLFAALLMSKFYPNSVIGDLLSEPSR